MSFTRWGIAAAFKRPDFVIYTHVDLARLSLIPSLAGVPYAVFLYGVESWRPFDQYRRRALENASVVFAISTYTVRRAIEANPWLKPPRVIWLGVDHPAMPTPLAKSANTAVLVGRMQTSEKYKGHDEVLAAWPLVAAQVSEAHLKIIGDGDDRARLEGFARGIRGVEFTGFVTNRVRQELVQAASVFLNLSKGEGFGLAAMEAAAMGVPIIGLRDTVAEELFPDGAGHVLLDNMNPETIARAMGDLLKNPVEATRIGEVGRQRVRAEFTLDHFRRRLRQALGHWFSAGAVTSKS